jgi:hypothetical protein
MFLTGVISVGVIGSWPGMRVGVPIMLWTFGGLGLFLAGVLTVVWRAMP